MFSLPINLQTATFSLEPKSSCIQAVWAEKSKVLSSWAFISLIFIKCTQLNLYSQCFGLNCLKHFCWAFFYCVPRQSCVCHSSALFCSASKFYICAATSIIQLWIGSAQRYVIILCPWGTFHPRTSKSPSGWQLGVERSLLFTLNYHLWGPGSQTLVSANYVSATFEPLKNNHE